MANNKSALKRIRQSEVRRISNKYFARSTRNAIRELRGKTNKEEAVKFFPRVVSMIDRLAKRNIIHKNKASNLKSGLSVHINKL
jgi:small subunit ribosomal protein S20